MGIRNGGFMAFVGPAPDTGGEPEDYRAPRGRDTGRYDAEGMLGSYSPTSEPFPSPDGVRRFTGFGADEGTLERGYAKVSIREDPAYDKVNYEDRWTVPKNPNEDMGETDVMRADWEFRGRGQRSRGFLTRPRVPTERG